MHNELYAINIPIRPITVDDWVAIFIASFLYVLFAGKIPLPVSH